MNESMLEPYRDFFDAPTEADVIIAEAQEKLRDMFNSVTKATCEQARNAQFELSRLQGEITAAQYKLEAVQREAKDVRQRMEQYKRHQLPRQFVEDMLHEATADIVPGQKVWTIKYKSQEAPCQDCDGSGELIAKRIKSPKGESVIVKCPTCRGYGVKSVSIAMPQEETVSLVNLKLCFYPDSVSYWSMDCIYTEGSDYGYSVDDVYNTLEEAQAKADKLNAKRSDA